MLVKQQARLVKLRIPPIFFLLLLHLLLFLFFSWKLLRQSSVSLLFLFSSLRPHFLVVRSCCLSLALSGQALARTALQPRRSADDPLLLQVNTINTEEKERRRLTEGNVNSLAFCLTHQVGFKNKTGSNYKVWKQHTKMHYNLSFNGKSRSRRIDWGLEWKAVIIGE